jgi:hypothetical protein
MHTLEMQTYKIARWVAREILPADFPCSRCHACAVSENLDDLAILARENGVQHELEKGRQQFTGITVKYDALLKVST